jgi:hypothetical protein
MCVRSSVAALLLGMVYLSLVYSQECQDCRKRRVIHYDNEVTLPRPFANPDSIFRYWDYFYITGGVKSYLSNQDPTRDCITRLDGAFFTIKDSAINSIKFGQEYANLPPPGELDFFTDYLIYGTVSGSQVQTVTVRLEAGKTRELVKSVMMTLPPGFNPIDLGKTLAASLGPLYSTIMDFERKKRDQGEPYAISPKITLIPDKTKLKISEKTNIDVLFRDCDGAPLKQRHITCTADGGTLKSADVTTDDQGHGTLEFTAGPSPALANVTSEYRFQKPTGQMLTADMVPASIQIDKPSTAWYVTAAYQIDNTSELKSQYPLETITSIDQDNTKITFSAWVTNISPVSGQFTSTWLNVNQLAYTGSFSQSSSWHKYWEASSGGSSAMIDDQLTSVRSARSTKARTPELTLGIYKDTHSFGISQMDAAQTGGETEVRRSVDPISGSKSETTVTPASPQKTLGLSVTGVNRDTTITDTTTTSSLGRSTTTVTQVVQKFSWKDNVCKLTYARGIRVDSRYAGSYTEDTHSNQTYTVTLLLTYTGDPPTGVGAPEQTVPEAFDLRQNYPNPFNPSTTVSYSVPRRAIVLVRIFNALGQEIARLVNELKEAGTYQLTWNASNVPSGIYFYRLQAGEYVETKKMILLK